MTAEVIPLHPRAAVICTDPATSVRSLSEAFGMMLRAHPDGKRIPMNLRAELADVLDRIIDAVEKESER